MNLSPQWMTFILSFLIVAGNVLHFVYLNKFKVQRLEKDDEKLTSELKNVVIQISHLAMQLKVAVTRQNVMNRMSTQAMTGLIKRIEELERDVKRIDRNG